MLNPYLVLDRAIAVHRCLLDAGIDNAIGGALCLAFHTDDPRGTQDIDVNVSLPASRSREALIALPDDVPWDEQTVANIERDEQVRIFWPVPGSIPMPLDLFFAVADLHEVARRRAVTVSMRGEQVKILSATDLTVFKALFARPKDWVDIEAMLSVGDSTVDLDDAVGWLSGIVGEDDPRTQRLRSLR